MGKWKSKKERRRRRAQREHEEDLLGLVAPDDEGQCIICGQSPIVPGTGMCGPCTFGEGDLYDGSWMDDGGRS